jgi:hypothetical protein
MFARATWEIVMTTGSPGGNVDPTAATANDLLKAAPGAVPVVGESVAQLKVNLSRDITWITFLDWPKFDVRAPVPLSR